MSLPPLTTTTSGTFFFGSKYDATLEEASLKLKYVLHQFDRLPLSAKERSLYVSILTVELFLLTIPDDVLKRTTIRDFVEKMSKPPVIMPPAMPPAPMPPATMPSMIIPDLGVPMPTTILPDVGVPMPTRIVPDVGVPMPPATMPSMIIPDVGVPMPTTILPDVAVPMPAMDVPMPTTVDEDTTTVKSRNPNIQVDTAYLRPHYGVQARPENASSFSGDGDLRIISFALEEQSRRRLEFINDEDLLQFTHELFHDTFFADEPRQDVDFADGRELINYLGFQMSTVVLPEASLEKLLRNIAATIVFEASRHRHFVNTFTYLRYGLEADRQFWQTLEDDDSSEGREIWKRLRDTKPDTLKGLDLRTREGSLRPPLEIFQRDDLTWQQIYDAMLDHFDSDDKPRILGMHLMKCLLIIFSVGIDRDILWQFNETLPLFVDKFPLEKVPQTAPLPPMPKIVAPALPPALPTAIKVEDHHDAPFVDTSVVPNIKVEATVSEDPSVFTPKALPSPTASHEMIDLYNPDDFMDPEGDVTWVDSRSPSPPPAEAGPIHLNLESLEMARKRAALGPIVQHGGSNLPVLGPISPRSMLPPPPPLKAPGRSFKLFKSLGFNRQ